MEEYEEINFDSDNISDNINLEVGNELLEKNTEITEDENGDKVRIVYFDDNYNITTKDKAVYKSIEEV